MLVFHCQLYRHNLAVTGPESLTAACVYICATQKPQSWILWSLHSSQNCAVAFNRICSL